MGSELLDYFNGDELAANVWLSKYAQEGEKTPDDMHRRLAKEFARIEDKYKLGPCAAHSIEDKILSKYGIQRKGLTEKSIYELFKDFKYIVPQGSIMAQLGSSSIGSLSNCFVLGQPVDSYGGIFQKEQQMIQLMKRRGGVGIDISTLRPEGTATTNAAKSSTGAVSFMHRFSNGTREVAQNGRRGALMLSIDINHPDVMQFIKIKRDLTQVTGANISIKLNNEFMEAVENDEDYLLKFPCNYSTSDLQSINKLDSVLIQGEYNKLEKLKVIEGWVYVKRIKAREYWDEIIKSAHNVAEPGLMFWDNMTGYSPDGVYPQFKQVTTNPCAEIGMQPYDACRLIAVNLYSFVHKPFTKDATFDFGKFYAYNYEAMRLSDDLIDLELEHIDRILTKIENDPEEDDVKMAEYDLWHKIRSTAKASRRTGLGLTALGDTLAALGLKYDSEEGLYFIEALMKTKMESELDCTIDLAILRGPFEGWDNTLEYPTSNNGNAGYNGNDFYSFIRNSFPEQYNRMYQYGRRNVSWSTVAPTGTVSLLTQTTSGLEPLFMPFYMRRKKVNPNDKDVRVDFTDQNGDTWQEFPVIHPKFQEWIKLWWNDVACGAKTLQDLTKDDLEKAFKFSPWYGSTANDINWVKRVEIQGVIQKYITHSISSTINLPENVTEAEVSQIYLESWKKGLKGITVYRDGSRSGVLVSESNKDRNSFDYVDSVKRPKELEAEVHLTKVGGQPVNVFIGLLNNKPYEIFIDTTSMANQKGTIVKKSKGNYTFKSDNTTAHIISDMNDEQAAITRLTSTALRHGADIKFIVEQLNKCDGDLFSFTKALARVLKKYIPDGEKSTVKCNDCGSDNVIFEEGCSSCKDCGSSKCG